MSIKVAMKGYFDNLLKIWDKKNSPLPTIPRNEEVDPSFYVGEPDDDDWVQWEPREKNVFHDFARFEKQYGITIHPSIKEYFNSYWFLMLEAIIGEKAISLMTVAPGIELRDFENLLEGCEWEGSFDFFFMGSEVNESIPIAVSNNTGEVFIHDPERETYEKIAENLEDLIYQMAKALE